MIIVFGLIFALSSVSAGILREPLPAYGPPVKTETTITEIQPSALIEHKLPVVQHVTFAKEGHHHHPHPHYEEYEHHHPHHPHNYEEYYYAKDSPIVTYAKHENHHVHRPHHKPHYEEYYYAKDSPVVTYAKEGHHHHPHHKPHYEEYYYAKDSPVVTYAKEGHHHHPHHKPHYEEYYYAKDTPVVTYAKEGHHHPHHPHHKPHYEEHYYAKDTPVVTYAKEGHHHPHHPHHKPHYEEHYYAKDSAVVTYAKEGHHHPHHPHHKPHYEEYYYAKDTPIVTYAKEGHHHPHHPHHKPQYEEYYYAKDSPVVTYAKQGHHHPHHPHHKPHYEEYNYAKEGLVDRRTAEVYADHEKTHKALIDAQKEAEKKVLDQQEQLLGLIKETEMKLEREPIADVKYPGVMYLPPSTLPEPIIRNPIEHHETILENTEDHELAHQIHFDAEKKIRDQQRDYLELIKLAEQEREREIVKEGYKEPTLEYLPPVKSYETTTYRPLPEHEYHTTETATMTTENYEHAHQALLDAQKEVLGTHEQYLEFHKEAEKQQLLTDGIKEIEKGSLYLPPVINDATTETIVKAEDLEHAHQSLLEAQKEVIGQQQSYLEFHKEAEKKNIHELTVETVKPTGGDLGFGGYSYQVPHVLYGPPKPF